ncbi:putative ATP-dependent RNA helicase TDRD12 [Mantella aurantiaca]
MFELSVIKVIDPSCFFCEILEVTEHKDYEQLFQELNMLYSVKYRDVEELKPISISIGQRCMVFCEERKSWCRASLESQTCSAEDDLVECFLLDHAVHQPIRKSNVRLPVEECFLLPFRATKFKLHDIQPISLSFNIYENKMNYRPTKDWDSAAVLYFHQILEEASKIEAQLCSVEDNCISIYLYVVTKDSMLCVNDDLVAKKFASSVDVKIENGCAKIPLVKEIQLLELQNGALSKGLQSPGHKTGPMARELLSPGHKNGHMARELQSPGHKNGPMARELQSQAHLNGALVKEQQSLGHQNETMARDLQSQGHQNGPMARELQSQAHLNGALVKEQQSLGHQNGPMARELQSQGHQNGPMIKELHSMGHQNGALIKEPQSSGHQKGALVKDLQSLDHQNGALYKELHSLGHQNGALVKEPQSSGHQNGSLVKDLQSSGHHNGALVKDLQSSGHQNGAMVKDLQSSGHQNGAMVKDLQSSGHQNGALFKDLQSSGHQNGVKPVYLSKEESKVPAKEMTKTISQPILWSAWRCLDDGHITDTSEKMETTRSRREVGSPSCADRNVSAFVEQRQRHPSFNQRENGSVLFNVEPQLSDIHNGRVVLQEDASPSSDEAKALEGQHNRGMGFLQKQEPRCSGVQKQSGMVFPHKAEPGALGMWNESGMVFPHKAEPEPLGMWSESGMFFPHKPEPLGMRSESGMVFPHKAEPEALGMWNESGMVFPHKAEPEPLGMWNESRMDRCQKDEPAALDSQSGNSSKDKYLPADIQNECRLFLSEKDKPTFLGNQGGRPLDLLLKENTQYLASHNGSRPDLLQTDQPSPLGSQHGRPSTLLLNDKVSETFNSYGSFPLDEPHQSSSNQRHKVVTSPDTEPNSLDSTECGPNLLQDFSESNTAEIRGRSKETTCLPDKEEMDPFGSPFSKEFTVVQSPWPALCKVDRARRLSNEIKEKSIARIRTLSGNSSSSAPDNTRQSLYFSKLLQFLNPIQVQLSEGENDELPKVVRKHHQTVFVSKTIIAHPTLESASFSSGVKKHLMVTGYSGPNVTESYCWAPIAEGSDTIVIAPNSCNPMCYIPPLLSYLNCATAVYKVLPAKHGPHMIVLCPTWDKCHAVYNLFMDYSKYGRLVNPMLVLVGQSDEEIERLNFRRQCELVVTTPHCLVRCMEHHGLLLLRLCHLVLDEVDVLFAKARSQMSAILEAYKKTVSMETRDGTCQQIVAVGNAWHQDMELLLNCTSCPQVIITRMEQATVFANVQQILHLCLDDEKLSMLLQCLDFTPVNAQKILIFTASDEEAELVHKAVQTGSTYSLLLHRKEVHNFTYILEQWRKTFSRGTVLSLVVTDDYAPILDITDATRIIHYSFPANIEVLNKRLFSLLDYIQSKIDKVTRQEEDCFRAKSVLLMTEKHIEHAVDVLHSLQQSQAQIPPELIGLTEGILQGREERKSNQELCPHLKRLGYCIQDKFSCPSRHHVNPAIDLHSRIDPILEPDQNITVLPLCILDAASFYGRIVTKDDPYEKFATHLNLYYNSADNRVPARNVETNQLYALSDTSAYHRVLVLQRRTVSSVLYVTVQYIDQGGTDHIPGHKLLQLPSVFHSLPPQYLEFIICRVKPIDSEVKWDSKVTRLINRSIRGKIHRAKVVLNLGKTYWLDPMVQMSSLTGLSTYVYDLNVRQEILFTGMATDNPEHVTQLKALLNSAKTPLLSAVRSSEECITRPENEEPQVTSPPAPVKERESDKQEDMPKESLPIHKPPTTSLHPDVKWFEKGDAVFLTVKLQEISDHKCAFHPASVLFSCHAGGKHYKADMNLYKEIITEKSECSVKNGEATITLMKKKCETWPKLLTHKHPSVTYDFDHLEDSEDSTSYPTVHNPRKMPYTFVSESMECTDCSETESSSD